MSHMNEEILNVFIRNEVDERSYLADSLLDDLNCRANKLPTREFVMKTFLGSSRIFY